MMNQFLPLVETRCTAIIRVLFKLLSALVVTHRCFEPCQDHKNRQFCLKISQKCPTSWRVAEGLNSLPWNQGGVFCWNLLGVAKVLQSRQEDATVHSRGQEFDFLATCTHTKGKGSNNSFHPSAVLKPVRTSDDKTQVPSFDWVLFCFNTNFRAKISMSLVTLRRSHNCRFFIRIEIQCRHCNNMYLTYLQLINKFSQLTKMLV
jgi:hypothetical protein